MIGHFGILIYRLIMLLIYVCYTLSNDKQCLIFWGQWQSVKSAGMVFLCMQVIKAQFLLSHMVSEHHGD